MKQEKEQMPKEKIGRKTVNKKRNESDKKINK